MSHVRIRTHFAADLEGQLAEIDRTRAQLEAMCLSCPATPLHEAVEAMLFDLRRIAVTLLPAALAIDQAQREEHL